MIGRTYCWRVFMPCENNVIKIKSGSDVVLAMIYKDDAGIPISLVGYEIFMDFNNPKTGERLVGTWIDNGITITEVAGDATTTGTYTVNPGNSKFWPLGEMPVDILYRYGGLIGTAQHTEDFILDFIKGHTQEPIDDVFTPS